MTCGLCKEGKRQAYHLLGRWLSAHAANHPAAQETLELLSSSNPLNHQCTEAERIQQVRGALRFVQAVFTATAEIDDAGAERIRREVLEKVDQGLAALAEDDIESCGICGDHHEPDRVPYPCQTGDGV
jgi:hypothetical protein